MVEERDLQRRCIVFRSIKKSDSEVLLLLRDCQHFFEHESPSLACAKSVLGLLKACTTSTAAVGDAPSTVPAPTTTSSTPSLKRTGSDQICTLLELLLTKRSVAWYSELLHFFLTQGYFWHFLCVACEGVEGLASAGSPKSPSSAKRVELQTLTLFLAALRSVAGSCSAFVRANAGGVEDDRYEALDHHGNNYFPIMDECCGMFAGRVSESFLLVAVGAGSGGVGGVPLSDLCGLVARASEILACWFANEAVLTMR